MGAQKTTNEQKILAMLLAQEGAFRSGEEMSTQLGVSRATVGKAIESLRQDGYDIESVTRRGHRLVSAPDRLTSGTILPYLSDADARERLICLDCVDSTNTYAKKLAMEGGVDGTPIVANEQTGGRGRLGRSFQSPKDVGVYLTMLYRPPVQPTQAVNLTAYVAVAICEGIEHACGLRPTIKWTNDIVAGGRKLCGILTEMAVEGESGTLQYVVTGVGVNANQQRADFAPELDNIATSLALELGHPVCRGRLAAELIHSLNEMYAHWLRGTGDYWTRYRDRCVTLGKQVKIIRGTQEMEAFAEDLDEDFGLVVRCLDGHRERVTAGEVSVRGLWGYAP